MRRALFATLAIGTAISMAGLLGPALAAAEPLPVPHDANAGLIAMFQNPGGALEGANDFSCTLTAEHPRPVVLVHGTFSNQQMPWTTFVPLLKNEGYCVFALTYGTTPNTPWPLSEVGGLGAIPDSARQVGDFVDEVLAATGAEQVDILGHSQGTFVPNYWVKFLGGQDKVANYVSLAPLWSGSNGGYPDLAGEYADLVATWCASCVQMSPNSEIVAQMNAGGGPYVAGIAYTNIMTRYDDIVTPYTAGYVEGPETTNIVVQDGCELDQSRHLALASSPVAAGYVLNALDPHNHRPVPCMAVSADTGSPVR